MLSKVFSDSSVADPVEGKHMVIRARTTERSSFSSGKLPRRLGISAISDQYFQPRLIKMPHRLFSSQPARLKVQLSMIVYQTNIEVALEIYLWKPEEFFSFIKTHSGMF